MLALALTVALVPLIVTPGLLFYFDVTPKIVVLLLGTAAALPLARRRMGLLQLVLAAQFLWLLLVTALSTRPELSLYGSNWRRFGLIAQAALLVFTSVTYTLVAGNPHRVRTLVRAMAAAGIPAALYGLAQYFGWDPWIPARAYHVGEGVWTIVRTPGTLGHASYFANYLLFAVFAGTELWAVDAGVWRWVGLAAASTGSAAVVLSGTRGALLGLAAGVVFLLVRRRPRLSWPWLAVAAAAVLFYISPAGTLLRSRVHWASEDIRGGARLLLWRDSLRMAGRHWLLGTGPETFSGEFAKVESRELARAYPDFYYESPHNIFLDALTSQGVPGLVCLVAVIALGLKSGWRAAPHLTAALIAALVSHLFTAFVAATALYFYVTVVLLVALRSQPAVAPLRLRIALIPVSALLILAAVRLAAADRYLQSARQELDAGRVSAATARYASARRWGIEADLWYSRRMQTLAPQAGLLARIQCWQQAMEAGARATRQAEDRHNAWYNLATIYAGKNDFAATERSLREAIGCAPQWFKPHWMLARMLAMAGRDEEARLEGSIAVDLNNGRNPEVAASLEGK